VPGVKPTHPRQTINHHYEAKMSEYQYYEFQAIDKPLTDWAFAKVRARSTRAQVTRTRFVNEYHWGDFKGNPTEWMAQYFDAFMYLANWGHRQFAIRLPGKLLRLDEIRPYRTRSALSVRVCDDNLVLWFDSEDEDGDDLCETAGVLSSLIPTRDELMRGDRRALYLGWLLALQMGELDSEDVEPPVPPGLGELSGAQDALASFLRIDDDLLAVAADASDPVSPGAEPTEEALMAWLAKQPAADRDKWIVGALFQGSAPILAEVHRRFREAHAPPGRAKSHRTPRTVEDLSNAASARADERRRIAEQKAVAEAERLREKAEQQRKKYLDGLAGQEDRLWAEAGKLALTKQPLKYDAAVQLLRDLRDLAGQTGDNEFIQRLEAFRATHARKPSLLERIQKAKL
jgi:hypothetical protein